MPELPPPLPPAERTVGQLIAETIRLYGQHFWRALPLGPPAGVLARLRRRRVAVKRVGAIGAEHEALAEALHARAGWRTDRSQETVSWRFTRRPGIDYRLYEALDARGRSRAFAAVRLVLDRALLVDLQLDDEASPLLGDLLADVARDLDGSGAASLEVRCPQTGVLYRRLRAEHAFVEETSDAFFEVRPLPGHELGTPADASLFDYRYSDHDVF